MKIQKKNNLLPFFFTLAQKLIFHIIGIFSVFLLFFV